MHYRARCLIITCGTVCVQQVTVWDCKAFRHVVVMSRLIFTSDPNDVSLYVYTCLAMLTTGSASVPHSTLACFASSVPASATPAVMEPRVSRSHHWSLCVSVPMEDKDCCAMNVRITKYSFTPNIRTRKYNTTPSRKVFSHHKQKYY